MYDQVVKCQRAGLCLSEHFFVFVLVLGPPVLVLVLDDIVLAIRD